MSNTSQPRLLSFALDDWTALGGRVSVSLLNRVGVLVGRNGAGKSAILEGFEAISSRAVGRFSRIRQNDGDSIPKILDIEILTPSNRRLRYKYELTSRLSSTDDPDIDDPTNDNSEESQFSWNDCCRYVDEEKELLWTTETGVTTINNGDDPIITILGSTNSLRRLHPPEDSRLKLPSEMQWVYDVLRGVRLLRKAPVRQTPRRRPSFLQGARGGVFFRSGIADSLSRKILHRMEMGELDELESVCQRVGLGSKITIKKFILSGEPKDKIEGEDEEYVSSVLLDGVNIGLLSDGTLRVLSILIEIINSYPSATTIIEEPETQIHPGMLAKLLNEFETYTFEENLILSTHSQQVVAWTSPDKINLVHRGNGRTFVRQLSENEIQKVVEYLSEEGDLGDWLYSGVLDE